MTEADFIIVATAIAVTGVIIVGTEALRYRRRRRRNP